MIQDSIVDGPGFRFVLFAQGCEQHCEGCHNPDSLDPGGGMEISVEEIIREMLSNPLTDGLTLSGGEPFLQASQCARIAAAARERGLNVWAYTGYRFERLIEDAAAHPEYMELLQLTDVLIDGEFILSLRSLTLRWRGSRNQRVIDVPNSLAAKCVIELDI